MALKTVQKFILRAVGSHCGTSWRKDRAPQLDGPQGHFQAETKEKGKGSS